MTMQLDDFMAQTLVERRDFGPIAPAGMSRRYLYGAPQ